MIHRALFGSIERFFAILARALRRRVPRVARAGAGHGAAGRRPPRRRTRTRSPTRCRAARLPRRGPRRAPRHARRAHPPGEDARRCRTCSWSATTTSSAHRRREPTGERRSPSAASRSTRSSPSSTPSSRTVHRVMPLERLWAGWRSPYIDEVDGRRAARRDECLFCRLAARRPRRGVVVLARDDHAFAVMNAYPYTSGHLMVAPLRHEGDLEALHRRRGDRAHAI